MEGHNTSGLYASVGSASGVCGFCGGAGEVGSNESCTCGTPPEPDCSWSDTSSEGSLGIVVDIGYRDPSREYDFENTSIEVMVGDLRTMGCSSRLGGEEWGIPDGPSLLARTFRCGDLGFAVPITRERPADRAGIFVRGGTVIFTIGAAEMQVSRVSELPTQNWYETSTRSWPSWINRSREIYQTLYEAESHGIIKLVSSVGEMEAGNVLIDVPLPWYGGKVYKGQKLVGLPEADIWQWTAEHRRGDYGPQELISKVMVPVGHVAGLRKVFDTNPTRNNTCFMRGGTIAYEMWWELVELRSVSEAVGMPVWVYSSDLWDCSRRSIWLDRRSVEASRGDGLDYVIIGRDNSSGFVSQWADEDLSTHAEARFCVETRKSDIFMPSVETVFRVWSTMWNKASEVECLGDIARLLNMSEEAVLMCGQEPKKLVPYAQDSGCFFKMQRSSSISRGTEQIAEIPVEVMKRSVISCDADGYCVTSLGKGRLEVGRKHIGPVRVGEGSRFDLVQGLVGRQTALPLVSPTHRNTEYA